MPERMKVSSNGDTFIRSGRFHLEKYSRVSYTMPILNETFTICEATMCSHDNESEDNRATGRKETAHCLRLNLRWETLLNSETVAPQWIRVCGPAQYGLKAARRAPQFSKR